MATNFPSSLDALTNPTGSDTLASPDHAGQHADSNDAIEALQAKVGVDSSAVTSSLDYKVAQKVDKSLVDAKGDLIVASAADTVSRLAVGGTNGHVLTVDSAETLGVKWAAIAGMSELDAQTFTSSTTYTVVTGAKLIVVECIGAGGGGGAGRRGGGTQHGGGGAGGFYERFSVPASEVGASVTVTIGAGGAGAPRKTTTDGGGAAGSKGGNSQFGTFYFVGAMGGGGGSSGGAGERGMGYTGGLAMTVGSEFGTGGRAALIARKGWRGGGGGGAGSAGTGREGASSESDPPLTTTGTSYTATTGGGGAGGTGDGGNGSAGGASQGGGGGAGGTLNMGGNGGDGGAAGGGGGGGGLSQTGIDSGAGGTGGNAQIKIWVFG